MKETVIFLLGAMVGAAVALMFAPASGSELRAQIQSSAERDLDRLQSEWHQSLHRTNQKLDELQADVKQALKQVQAEVEEAA